MLSQRRTHLLAMICSKKHTKSRKTMVIMIFIALLDSSVDIGPSLNLNCIFVDAALRFCAIV